MRIREGEGRMWCDGEWYRRFEMPGGRDGIRGSWDTEMDLGEMAYRDGDGISELRDCAPGKSGNTTIGERTKCIRQRRSSTHTPPLTSPIHMVAAKQRKKKDPLATCTNIQIYTPPLSPPFDLPYNPLLNSSPNTNIPYVASADSATGIGLRPLSARGIDDPPSTTDARRASSTPSDSEFWMRMPPRASGHSSVSIGKVGRWGGGGGVGTYRGARPTRRQ